MSFPASACCFVVLNQQQQQHTYHHKQCADDASVNQGKTTQKSCTVVENGRVVVKPLQTSPSP
ncbi:MAG: hypothetical protein KME08_12970 [Aphanothece sp. CMT-3BRIN-NPC111]|jgi:hypothetical protein|nr:hypothetical protein [Aphanothece sp. CMT-3BRIN-NPC111]